MKALGIVMVLLGIACFVLPLLHVQLVWLAMLGNSRAILACILILVGLGIFFFSGYD